MLLCVFPGCSSTYSDPGPPYVIYDDSIYGITTMFELAEDNSSSLSAHLSQMGDSRFISTAEEVLELKSYIQNFNIPFVADMGGLDQLKTSIQYRNSDFSDASLSCSYSDADGDRARIQWFVERGDLEWSWEIGKILAYTWTVDAYTVKVFYAHYLPHFDLIGICQFDDHYLMFKFRSEDLRAVKEQLQFIQLGKITVDD